MNLNNFVKADEKIVYLNVDKIMQQSIAGKSIKKQLENLYNKNLEKFKINDELLKNKEKKLIAQKIDIIEVSEITDEEPLP